MHSNRNQPPQKMVPWQSNPNSQRTYVTRNVIADKIKSKQIDAQKRVNQFSTLDNGDESPRNNRSRMQRQKILNVYGNIKHVKR